MNKTIHSIYVGLFFVVGISVTVLLAVNGYQYYSLPLEERFFDSKDILLKPSGIIGHGIGIIGSLMMILGVAVYMIRKRVKRFVRLGGLKYWLEFHMFLCSVGPVLVLFHTSFKFGGIVSVSFWSMVAVVLSGVIGRFIYIQIPRTIQGQELSVDEINEVNSSLNKKLVYEYQISEKIINEFELICSNPSKKSFPSWLLSFPSDKLKARRCIKQLKKELRSKHIHYQKIIDVVKTMKAKMNISRKLVMLKTMQRLFQYWHIFHLPFAITMFVIMIVHIAVTIVFGYKWIF